MKTTFARATISLIVALAIPLVHLWYVCSTRPFSEKCVWGKAYLPLTLVLYAVLVTPVVYLVLLLVGRAMRR
ncbi:MAG TPA: hypothetical protein VHK90_16130 [Thermoanaerobaculia bacterium]|nr:hypothetical protein [Thermoanaerobaculia bacterium]